MTHELLRDSDVLRAVDIVPDIEGLEKAVEGIYDSSTGLVLLVTEVVEEATSVTMPLRIARAFCSVAATRRVAT